MLGRKSETHGQLISAEGDYSKKSTKDKNNYGYFE